MREKTLQTCLSEKEVEAIIKLSEEEGISVSAFIRRAVRQYLKNIGAI